MCDSSHSQGVLQWCNILVVCDRYHINFFVRQDRVTSVQQKILTHKGVLLDNRNEVTVVG